MTIPKQLKIGGHIVTVDCTQEIPGADGDFSSEKNLIRISKELPQSQKESTLIHEIFHAINSELDGIVLGHIMMESLSQQLYQVLADNKLLK